MPAELITDNFMIFLADRYQGRRPFKEVFDEYVLLPDFDINGNVLDSTDIYDDDVQTIVRLATQYYLTLAFKAMKVNLDDPNVKEDLSVGNIGTPGRLSKMFVSSGTGDMSEPLAGRWTKKPRMASFPNDTGDHNPVFVTTKLDAMCSHHLIRFGDDAKDENSFVVIGYIPEDKLGGISKINRFVEWCSRRGWLQEKLTEYIANEIKSVFETGSVYVALLNNKHGCASTRGACDREAATTTIVKTGDFKTNPDLIPSRFRG